MFITTFQKIELVLIPIVFTFSQILVLSFGFSIIGEDIWNIMGFPMILGLFISILILLLIQRYLDIDEFTQLEVFFRRLTIVGGIVIVIIIAGQMLVKETGLIIFSIQTLIISVIGDIMTVLCIISLKKAITNQVPSK